MNAVRVRAVIRRIIDQFRHDHRSLALLVLVPIVISALLGWILTSQTVTTPQVAAVVGDALLKGPVTRALEQVAGDGGLVNATDSILGGLAPSEEVGREMLRDGRADAVLIVPAGTAAAAASGARPTVTVLTLGVDPARDAAAAAAVGKVLAAAFAARASGVTLPMLVHGTIFGKPDPTQLDILGPVFIGFFAYFLVFILTGISFLRERTGGTLERLMATPITRIEIVTGYSLGFGLFATLQVVVFLAFALASVSVPAIGPLPAFGLGLGIANAGSTILVFAVTLLAALGSVNLAIFLSTFARTEFQIVQFIPLVIVPQAFLCGIFWPIDTLPALLQPIARLLPLTYTIEGLRAVMVRGADLGDRTLQIDLLFLAGIALVFAALATRTIRRQVA
jgi:ABC-2 type transport system permease protein